MTSLLVLSVFRGEDVAARVLGDMRSECADPAGLISAATLNVWVEGGYSLGTSARPGEPRGFPGMFWEALFGLVFFVPVRGSSYGPGAGAVFGTLANVGVDEEFLARLREALRPGTSAVALLLGPDDCEALGDLCARGGTLIGTSLSQEQDEELERELGGPI